MKKFLIISLLFLLIILLSNCSSNKVISSLPDDEGNLTIINSSDLELVLFANGEAQKIIPNTPYKFIVFIQPYGDDPVDLKVYSIENVSSDYNPIGDYYSSFYTVLSNKKEKNPGKTWIIE